MPIVRTYNDVQALAGLAHESGFQQGRGQHFARQQAIDARTSQAAIQAAMARNASPTFADRYRNAGVPGGGGDTGVQAFERGGRVGSPEWAAYQEREAARSQEAQRQRMLDRMQAAVGDPDALARLQASYELTSDGKLSDSTLNRLGSLTTDDAVALQREGRLTQELELRASGALGGTREGGNRFASLPAKEESAALAAMAGQWAGLVQMATRKEGAGTYDATGTFQPPSMTDDAVRARTGIQAALPHVGMAELEAGRSAFSTAGDQEAVAMFEAEIARRDQVDLVTIQNSIAPQDVKLQETMIDRFGAPATPADRIAFEQAYREGLRAIVNAHGLTLERYMTLYNKQNAELMGMANQMLIGQRLTPPASPSGAEGTPQEEEGAPDGE